MSETPRTDAHATPKGEDGTDWINADFARLLERELATLHEQLAEARKENDTLRGLLGNSAKPCPYCGLAAEDQAKCQHGFPGCSRADDQMLSKHFADAYRAEQAEAQLAERDAEVAALKGSEYRAGMRAAAAMCHAKADAVFAANPGRKRGTVSGIGGYAGHLIKDLGSAILAEADK